MTNFNRGDVVMVDLGMIAKVRPCVVISIPRSDQQRNMTVVVPMTTEIRGGACEIGFPKPQWLREHAVVNLLGIVGVDNVRIERRLGPFPGAMDDIDRGLYRLLGLMAPAT